MSDKNYNSPRFYTAELDAAFNRLQLERERKTKAMHDVDWQNVDLQENRVNDAMRVIVAIMEDIADAGYALTVADDTDDTDDTDELEAEADLADQHYILWGDDNLCGVCNEGRTERSETGFNMCSHCGHNWQDYALSVTADDQTPDDQTPDDQTPDSSPDDTSN